MIAWSQLPSWAVTLVASTLTFALGLLVPRFWMSKKERKDVEQANYANSVKLLDDHQAAYRGYTDAIAAYRAPATGGSFELFVAVAKAGDDYFRKARFTCDAILSDKVDHQHRDNTLVAHFERIVKSTLPEHYAFMQREAVKHGKDYRGELRRDDHQSIYVVVEKYGSLLALGRPDPKGDNLGL